MLGVVAEALGTGCKVAEVGVLRGAYAKSIEDVLNPAQLHLIDPWRAFSSEDYSDYTTFTQAHWDKMAAGVQAKFPTAHIMRRTSQEAVAAFEDGALDFVYIDANHGYKSVLDDLRAWFPKVRGGGILGGHDYDLESVKRAVDEFVFTNDGIKLGLLTNEKQCVSYFLCKQGA